MPTLRSIAPLGLFTISLAAAAAPLPRLEVTKDDTVVTQSCEIVFPAVIADANQDGVLHIKADRITLRFASGTALRGAPDGTPWDQLRGIGVRLDGRRDVVLQGLRVHGFKNAVVASGANALVIDGGDFSDNYRQHLKSTPEAEQGDDWLFPLNNDETKWRNQYGGALCVESSTNVTIRGVRIRRGQNGIVLDRVEASSIYDNDCSFLSGWGLALWRSSHNHVTRNAFDFCVRGHVEGVYNRGQDSAGILCFEQSSDNVFAENSATHGGDCFFGFAGHDAIGEKWTSRERARLRKETGKQDVDSLIQIAPDLAKSMSALGCNRNLLIENDLSYAPAHGIEMTFSEGNLFVRNRLVENAICGIWGGYSSGTLITGNEFNGNGGMAYGLECGAINMEHAADNTIVKNRFTNDKCAIHLWWDDDGGLLKFPGVAGGEKGVVGNVIAGNRFEINSEAPFKNLRPDARLVLLRLRDTGQGGQSRVASNYFFQNTVHLTHTQAVEFAVKPGIEPITSGKMPSIKVPKYRVLGKTRPIGARPQLRGREQILMDEWGPWDHEGPLVRPVKSGMGEQVMDLFGLKGLKAEVVDGQVTATLTPGATASSPARLVIRAKTGVARYNVLVTAPGFTRNLTGLILAADWRVRLFPWKVDPREDLAGWRKLADGPDVQEAVVPRIDFPFGMGGPRDLKISDAMTRRGPEGDHFGLIGRTTLALPKGRWRFRTNSDDGVRVLVNDRPVIENWTWHVPTTNTGVFEQDKDGDVAIVVEYFEIDGFATLKLEIEPVAG